MVMGTGMQCGNLVSIVLSTKDSAIDGQTWALRQDGVIANSWCDTKAINIEGGSSSNGANLILYSIHDNAN